MERAKFGYLCYIVYTRMYLSLHLKFKIEFIQYVNHNFENSKGKVRK